MKKINDLILSLIKKIFFSLLFIKLRKEEVRVGKKEQLNK